MEGMNCLCQYNGAIENEGGKPKYIGGEASLRYIRRDVAHSHFVRMMEDLTGNKKNETPMSILHFVFGVASKVKDDTDYQAMFKFYESNPQQPLRIWIAKHSKNEDTASPDGVEEKIICPPKLVDDLNSHRISNKTSKKDLTGKNNVEDLVESTSHALPAHAIFTIKSFSSLLKNSVEKYECPDFESGEYKWKLCLYPNGDKNENVKDHISLYLAIADAESLPSGWEIDVIYRLFLFDQKMNRYVTVKGGIEKRFRRFHASKTEWGFSHLIPLKTFSDPTNGYLINDTCIFGVDMFVSKCLVNHARLTVAKDDTIAKLTWNVDNYSIRMKERYLMSEEFSAGGYKWRVRLYPSLIKGYMSLFLNLNGVEPVDQKVHVKSTLRLLDQKNGKHVEHKEDCWFDKPGQYSGRDLFIESNLSKNEANGFLVKDTYIVEAEVTIG